MLCDVIWGSGCLFAIRKKMHSTSHQCNRLNNGHTDHTCDCKARYRMR